MPHRVAAERSGHRENQLRTSRAATAAVIGAGIVAALGTATVLVAPSLHLGEEQDALQGRTTGHSQTVQHTQRRGDDGERDDDGGFTVVDPPQRGTVAPPAQQSGTTSRLRLLTAPPPDEKAPMRPSPPRNRPSRPLARR